MQGGAIDIMKDIFASIEQLYPSFSKGQKAIADYLLAHYEKAAFMTAAKLGQAVGVSESTVVRFVTELGFESYQGLKQALHQLSRNRLTALQRVQITEERIRDDGVLGSVLSNDIINISQTLAHIDPIEFESSIEKIVAARNVYIIGVRTASMLSEFLGYNLNLICDNIRPVNASGTEEVFEQIVRIGKDDVIIGISFPRYSQRTIRALNFARDRGADVIAITDAPSSPLAQFATNLLLARSDMASFVDSLTAPMSLINALIVGVTMKRRQEIEKRLGELEQIWDEYQVYDKQDGGRADV